MKTVLVTGHRGMVGSALLKRLALDSLTHVICADRKDLDLLNQQRVLEYFRDNKPNEVYHVAGKVGGIIANADHPAEFIFQNLQMQCNVINSAYLSGVTKLLFLGSSCIYPKYADQPISESDLLRGPLEQTNRAYAVAKIAGVEMCRSYNAQYGLDYRCLMPTNLYGPGDNYDAESSHVLAGLVRKFVSAVHNDETVVHVWGSGKPLREFLHVSDLADACIHVMNLSAEQFYKFGDVEHVNVGSGIELSISELARLIAGIAGYKGEIRFDESRPDGTPRKRLNISRMVSLGWSSKVDLSEGISACVEEFRLLQRNTFLKTGGI